MIIFHLNSTCLCTYFLYITFVFTRIKVFKNRNSNVKTSGFRRKPNTQLALYVYNITTKSITLITYFIIIVPCFSRNNIIIIRRILLFKSENQGI